MVMGTGLGGNAEIESIKPDHGFNQSENIVGIMLADAQQILFFSIETSQRIIF